jgi:hypothetical protein
MLEAVARILSMSPGALKYAPSQGYDLLNLVNSKTTGDLTGVQNAVVAALMKDERIQSAGCSITQTGRTSYSVTVRGVGAQGPFANVFSLTGSGLTALSYS